jgi:hypothetical protein
MLDTTRPTRTPGQQRSCLPPGQAEGFDSTAKPDIAALSSAATSPWGAVLLGVDATRRALVRFQSFNLRTIGPITTVRGYPLLVRPDVSMETVNYDGSLVPSTTYLTFGIGFDTPNLYRLDVATAHATFLGQIINPSIQGTMIGITSEPVVVH